MKAFVNGITFTQLYDGTGCAIVHPDATFIDATEDELERQLSEGVYEDYLIPTLYKGCILFALEDGVVHPRVGLYTES